MKDIEQKQKLPNNIAVVLGIILCNRTQWRWPVTIGTTRVKIL